MVRHLTQLQVPLQQSSIAGHFRCCISEPPSEVSHLRAYIDGGTNVTVDGVDMSSLATLGTQTSNQKCRWGDKFTAATTVRRRTLVQCFSGSDSTVKGTKINAVSCLSPSTKYAGFTIVEFYNAGNLMTSNTNLALLLTHLHTSLLSRQLKAPFLEEPSSPFLETF